MTTEPAGSPWGGTELLERALGYTRFSLVLVRPEVMTAPTPCVGWDVHDLLVHMNDSLVSLHEAGTVRTVRLTPHRPDGGDDLVGSLRRLACELLADWSAEQPEGNILVNGRQLTSGVLAAAGALEVAVHGWDLAVACGEARPLPRGLAEDLLRVTPVLVTEDDRRRRFAAPLPAPDDADPSARLLAYLGRDPRAR